MTLKTNLDYVTSKLDYKNNEIVDLYTLRIRRPHKDSREAVLKIGLTQILNGPSTNGD